MVSILSTLSKLLQSLLRFLFLCRARQSRRPGATVLRWFSTLNHYSRGKDKPFFQLSGQNALHGEFREHSSTACYSSCVGATIPSPPNEIQEEVRRNSSLNDGPFKLVLGTQRNISIASPEPMSPSSVPPRHELRPITATQLIPPRRPRAKKVSVDTQEVLDPYTHPDMIPENAAQGYIPPYTTNFSPTLVIPGWECLLHPQGSVYYYNKELNIVTNVNILDVNLFQAMQETIHYILNEVQVNNGALPPDAQLVLDAHGDSNKYIFGYYFATLQGRTLFWMSEKYVKKLFWKNDGVQSYSHIGKKKTLRINCAAADMNMKIRSYNGIRILVSLHCSPAYQAHIADLFCRHLPLMVYVARLHYQHFPHVQHFTPRLVRELRGSLVFSIADQTFNAKTTNTYSPEELDKCLTIISNIPQDLISRENNESNVSLENCHEEGYFKWAIAYMMYINALHRFDHYHGQSNARWQRDHLLFRDSEQNQRLLLITLVSPLLFYSPKTYYRSLRDISAEGTVFFEAWKLFANELHREWSSLNIIATVLLAANMAFLAIPSLDNGDNPKVRSPAQICSYLSIVLSSSSIVLGQVFSRYHRIKGVEDLDERIAEHVDFLSDIGCDRLAIMYSLPYAYLSWSLIIFLVAFLIMCFQETQNAVRFSVGIPSAVLAMVMMWCVWRLRASDEERSALVVTRISREVQDLFRRYLGRERGAGAEV